MEQLWITLLIIGAGAVGYIIVTFLVQPILRYRNIKHEVSADLVFFANALDLYKADGSLQSDAVKRKESNRRHAAELDAICSDLPYLYHCWLRIRNEHPKEASKKLIGLSNSSTWRDAKPFEQGVKEHLRLKFKTISELKD